MDWDDDDPFATLQLEDLASPEDDASLPETVASSFAVATVTPAGSSSRDRFDVELCLLGPSGERASERTVRLLGMSGAEALRVAQTISELAAWDVASEFLVTRDDSRRLLPSFGAVAKAMQICEKYGESVGLPPGCKSSDELLCQYFDHMCEELQVQASEFQSLIEISEPVPNVLHVSVRGSESEVARAEAQVVLASMFMRMQEYYESPKETFRRRRFSCDDIRSLQHDANAEGFTYYTHWPGFNLPCWVFRDVMNGALGELRAQEVALLSCVAQAAGTQRAPQVTQRSDPAVGAGGERSCGAFYVIGSSADGDTEGDESGMFGMRSCREHELAHGLFFTTPSYREAVLAVVRNEISAADREIMRAELLSMGYADLPEIIEDEIQAYSVDGTKLGVYNDEAAAARAQIRALFDKERASQSQSQSRSMQRSRPLVSSVTGGSAAEPEPEPEQVTGTVRCVTSITVYKVLAGRDTTLALYNDECNVQAQDSVDTLPQTQDWKALYTQFRREHVLGTVPYRWEKDTEAHLVAITFSDLEVVVLDGPLLYDAAVSGSVKATAIKATLGIVEQLPLMAALGERGQAALVRETEQEWELIIPHELLKHLRYSERSVARFRCHPRMPVTHRWQRPDEGHWREWKDELTHEIVSQIPDLPVSDIIQ